LVIGHWSLVIGHWSLVIGHWSLVIGHWSLVIGHLLFFTIAHSLFPVPCFLISTINFNCVHPLNNEQDARTTRISSLLTLLCRGGFHHYLFSCNPM